MGVKERKIREKVLRRRAILKEAEKLFSGEKGLSATMDDLAEKTELAKGTLYLYFNNKEAILLALAQKGVGLLRKRMNRIPNKELTGIQRLSLAGDTFVGFLADKPFYASLFLHYESQIVEDTEGKRSLLADPVLQILGQILDSGKEDATIRDDIATRELVAILWSQMLGVLSTLRHRKEVMEIYGIDSDWLIKGHFRVIINGVKYR